MITKLSPKQHRIALTVLLEKVKTVPLSGFDDTEIGNKDTQCSWGLCNSEADRWPLDTRIWPERETYTRGLYSELADGKMVIKEIEMVYGVKDHLGCPMDKREKKSPLGCFYYCRFFQGPKPTVEEAIELVETEIKKYEAD